MDELRLAELRASREKTAELEALAVHDLEVERDKIQNLKKELKERTARRNNLMLNLIGMGYTKHRIAGHGGVAPSYINELEKK